MVFFFGLWVDAARQLTARATYQLWGDAARQLYVPAVHMHDWIPIVYILE